MTASCPWVTVALCFASRLGSVESPKAFKAFFPPSSNPVSSKLSASPKLVEFTKNLWFFSSKLALNPAFFIWSRTSDMVVSAVTSISTVLSPFLVFSCIFPAVMLPPVSSLSLESAFTLPPPCFSTTPPIMEPLLASCFTFKDCTPSIAPEPASTLTTLLLDTVVFFLVYASAKRIFAKYLL